MVIGEFHAKLFSEKSKLTPGFPGGTAIATFAPFYNRTSTLRTGTKAALSIPPMSNS